MVAHFLRRPSKLHLIALLAMILLCAQLGLAQYRVIHAFTGEPDGAGAWGSVAFDKQGSLYGTTQGGGLYGDGLVFEFVPQPDGTWDENVLYNFCSLPLCRDGAVAFSGPTLDKAGNVYGATQSGGGYNSGAVYELTPSGSGWNFAVLYNFCAKPNCTDGAGGWSGPILDQLGNLYGAAWVAYELSPTLDGSWAETTLHYFTGSGGDGDGFFPQAAPIMDGAGNVYGTTMAGGGSSECQVDGGCGTIYQLEPLRISLLGPEKENILHAFGSFQNDGREPSLGQLAMDDQGSLYGTTTQGGSNLCVDVGCGTVFKLSLAQNGTWNETILYNFTLSTYGPGGGVTFDKAGNLYGTTIYGGGAGCGAIYKLAPTTANGPWRYRVLHYFDGKEGCLPDANLTLGPDGNLYGTTAIGGASGSGVVFEITP